MNRIKRLALPLLIAGGVGLTMPNARAISTGSPARIADASLQDLKQMGIDKNDLDQTNGTGDSHSNVSSPPVDTNQDNSPDVVGNANDPNDANDANPQTYNFTLWALAGLLVLGLTAVLAAVRSRKTA